MGRRFLLGLCCLAFTVALSTAAAADDQRSGSHAWDYISYPPLPAPTQDSLSPRLTLRNGKENGLEFTLSYTILAAKNKRQELPPADKITVRFHTPDGRITDSQPDDLRGAIGVGNARASTYSYGYRFPWSRNVMEEAWIEVRLPEQTFWVEVPYGFTRNPSDPLNLDEARHGVPFLAAAMKNLGHKERIVPWLHVHYDLGEIQNRWRLGVNLANPFDAQAEVVLYRDDTQVGKSIYLWELHAPRTAATIKQPGARQLESMGMSIRLHEDGLRRSDSFKFNRNPGGDERCWGTAVIKVDDKSYECIVPSSLFKLSHGAGAPQTKASVPRKTEP